MILEAAFLYIKEGITLQFETDFKLASKYISSMDGYINHSLQKCIEQENKYLLLVQWNRLEDHTIGFRTSDQYLQWKELLHHYYEPFPIVEHFQTIYTNKKR